MLKPTIELDYRPAEGDEDDMRRCLADPLWRLWSGALYWILTKSEGKIPFRPNRAQRRFMSRLANRNLVLKARQRGFTTAICIMWLDHALFVPDQRCGIVAHDKESAEQIFKDKVALAYDNLPKALRELMPLSKRTMHELDFKHNNSSVRVATSMRSGTIHRLHVSEYGKICARYPDKADEVMTGSLPAVPDDGIAVIESTAEGKDGDFHDKAVKAISVMDRIKSGGRPLLPQEYRFHFSPWWEDPGYRLPVPVPVSERDADYFLRVELVIGQRLTEPQKWWWISTRDSVFSGQDEKMWQEYPSHPAEAFQVSTEGVYYARQLAAAQIAGRITRVPLLPGVPVDSFWDIGHTDGTAVWLRQKLGLDHRFPLFFEGWEEPYEFFTLKMQALGCMWGTHHLPHDANHKRQLGKRVTTPKKELEALQLGGRWICGPVIDRKIHGIQQTRKAFPKAWFDEEGCKEGLVHLGAYRKTWNPSSNDWSDEPRHDKHSEAADALREWGQSEAKLDLTTTTDYDIPLSKPNFRG